MKFDQSQFNSGNYKDYITVYCDECNNSFKKKYSFIKYSITHKADATAFCSLTCRSAFKSRPREEYQCETCSIKFMRPIYGRDSKQKFCNQSCAATYNNIHKCYGFRRSKLEKFIENELSALYPNLEILYNDRKLLGLEIDISIPSLKLAIEINGPTHYFPIYGQSIYDKIKAKDTLKAQHCLDKQIRLTVIDVTDMKVHNLKQSRVYLKQICDLISYSNALTVDF